MNETKHTPGPWEVIEVNLHDGPCKHALYVNGTGDYQFDEIAAVMMDYADNSPEANARLIAAAPDLLSACEKMRDVLNTSAYDLSQEEYNAATGAANTAIAKAKLHAPTEEME
jgi:hypothetical protein